MFDTYVTREEHSHHHHRHDIRVQEHRAPTDTSVALLKDMEAAAQAKLLATVRIDDSPIDCVVHEFMDSMSMRRNFLIRSKINGRPLEVDVNVDVLGSAHKPSVDRVDEVCTALVNALAHRIAVAVLEPAFKNSPRLLQELRRTAA